MKKILTLLVIALLVSPVIATGAVIQYIGTGRPNPAVKVKVSRNNGASWEQKEVKPGQTYHIPPDATHLEINNVPRNPKQNYKVKDGNIS